MNTVCGDDVTFCGGDDVTFCGGDDVTCVCGGDDVTECVCVVCVMGKRSRTN